MDNDDKRKKASRIGTTIFIILAVLTIGEFFIGAVAIAWWQPLVLISLIKSFFIIRDYMHVSRLNTTEGEIQS